MANDPLAPSAKALVPPNTLPSDLGAGAVIAGKYTLLRPIGVGGMGAVWVARNEATGAEVALKLLLRHPEDSADLMARFRQEAHTTARLSHRGIVRIYDLVDAAGDDSPLILVMELLRGQTLAAFLRERRRLPLEDALAIILPMLSALAHAHAAGVVHRDLKPENIFLAVDPDGHVTPKILDFGISKVRIPKAPIITRDGEMLGTPSYMSPEQVRGKPNVGRESDIFNVGILLYELLSGKNPFGGDGPHSMVVAILEEEPVRLGAIPWGVWTVIERALRKSPKERYASAADLATALRLAVGLPLTPSTIPPEMVSASEAALRPSGFTWAPPSTLVTEPSSHASEARRTRSRWGLVGIVAASITIITVPPLALGSRDPDSEEGPRPAKQTTQAVQAQATQMEHVESRAPSPLTPAAADAAPVDTPDLRAPAPDEGQAAPAGTKGAKPPPQTHVENPAEASLAASKPVAPTPAAAKAVRPVAPQRGKQQP